jgi:glycerophosphoryl diester phosphodiesterase
MRTLFLAAWLASAPALAAGPAAPLGPVMDIAHRGASYDAPEHTCAAYDRAILYDADFIECDLQISKDGVLVCLHDTTVDRTSNGSGRVDSLALAKLRTLDFGTWFNDANPARGRPEYARASIVPFEEQLDCYLRRNPRMRFHVETKAPAEYGGKMEPLLVGLLRRKGLLDTGDIQSSTIVVQSFDLESLRIVKQLAPHLPTAYLWSAPPIGTPGVDPAALLAGELPAFVDAAAPSYTNLLADPTYITRAHANGHVVHTWTVDDPQTLDVLLDLGVDGIFTNRPDVLRERIDARGTGVPSSVRRNPRSFPLGCPGIAGTIR